MSDEFRSISGNLFDESFQPLSFKDRGDSYLLLFDGCFHIRSSTTSYLSSGLFIEILLFLD